MNKGFPGELTQCNDQTTACSEAKVGKQSSRITFELSIMLMNFQKCVVYYINKS